MADRTLAYVVRGRKHSREHLVAPMNQRRCGPEIAAQFEDLEWNSREPRGAHGREPPDFGIAKAVDGLHRIAHQKERAAVPGRPVLSQCAQELVLITGGVLEFIDENVRETRADSFRERRGDSLFG